MWRLTNNRKLETCPRNSRQKLARRVGFAACGFFLATGMYNMSQIHPDHEGLKIVDTPRPVAATSYLRDVALPDEAHDPSLYAPVDMEDARLQLSRSLTSNFNALSALSLGVVGFGLLAGASVQERLYLQERQTRPIAEVAASQVTMLDTMLNAPTH